MIASALVLGAVGLASASPIASQITPHYPSTHASKGFRLVVNVTDPSSDLVPSVQNTYVTSIHVGAGLNLVGNIDDSDRGRIFYVNGTAADPSHQHTLSDGGTPPSPYGISLTQDEGSSTVSTARLDGGAGPNADNIHISSFPEPYRFLTPETWMACDEPVKYYQDQHFTIFKQADVTVDSDGNINYNIPDECVAVRLLPECAPLNKLPNDSYSSHEYALESSCYKDVASIDWSQYGP